MIKRLLDSNRPEGRFFYCLLAIAIAVGMAHATGPTLTTINDVVYRADGQPATGTLVISWTAFTTADNKPVAAGELSLTLGAHGSISTALAPNEGATPTGSYYKVVYKLSDGTTATEYWVVPAASPTTVANIRARVVPTQVAAQLVSRQYVDAALSGSDTLVVHKDGTESITGVKAFAVSPTAESLLESGHREQDLCRHHRYSSSRRGHHRVCKQVRGHYEWPACATCGPGHTKPSC